MSEEHINEIKAIIILALGMICLASLISFVPEDLPWYTSEPNVPIQNLIKITGAYLAGSLLFVFGYSSYFMVFVLLFWSWNKFTSQEIEFSPLRLISFFFLLGIISSLFGLAGPVDSALRFDQAGFIGLTASDFLLHYLGRTGSYIVLLSLGALALSLTGGFLITPFILRSVELFRAVSSFIKKGILERNITVPKWSPPKVNLNLSAKVKKFAKKEPEEDEEDKNEEHEEDEEYEDEGVEPRIKITKEKRNKKVNDKPKIVGEYKLPSLDLLDDPPEISTDRIQSDLINGAKLLEETLASFGVAARVADIERGPAITRYELEPGQGVKVQKFTTLSDDIALAMQAPTVRIVAPIPGKNRVGIEVPNGSSAAVFLKDVLSSDEFRNCDSKLTICLGKDIAGKPMIADLTEMPHLLIAGTTGSGKTVCVNSIIMSMLYNASPQELRLVLIDPKMVEMAQYNDIPHLLCPTVTDSKKAVNALNWVVGEMESRYKKLSKIGTRNIKGYNQKVNNEEDKLPYIVIIIDELADLMQVSGKAVEGSIVRLAQLSRAVGIHLILSTQRPSVNVITGVIKANLPARISFKVSSKIDSRTILDMNGAESLLGKGDMLFIKPTDAKPTRGQGNLVTDDEIRRVIEHIKAQQEPVYNETIVEQRRGSGGVGGDNDDPMYDEAVKLIVETNQASVSLLQRRMRLGYTRAARLIDMMEQNGIVGPYAGSKARDLLVDREQWLLDNSQQEDDQENE